MTTAVIADPAEVISYRYAARSHDHHGDSSGHLLTRSWTEQPGRGRPALCGVRRHKWRPVHLFERSSDFIDCADCTAASGIAPAPQRAPVRIAPAAPERRPDPIALTPAQALPNSQAARVARRAAFAASPVPLIQS